VEVGSSGLQLLAKQDDTFGVTWDLLFFMARIAAKEKLEF